MKLKFKNRIAFFNTLAAATSTLLVFVAVFWVVYLTAYKHLDDDIRKERAEILKSLKIEGERISVRHNDEWDEKEHKRVEVNPTFLQITDKQGDLVFQSPNLKNERLEIETPVAKPIYFDCKFNQERIRLGQFPIVNPGGQNIGQLSVGISQAESAMVLRNLGLTLLIAFPFLTLIFYWASSFAADRGIAPIHQLIETANKIDDQSIDTRLPLPPRRDEIFQLATTINELLHRIENSLKREKQITADISHELRTPLAGIRGTLEVLLRKRREPEQYEQKIEQVLFETDRMNRLLEQLLQLSRIEAGNVQPNTEQIELKYFFHALLEKWQPILAEKHHTVDLKIPQETVVAADVNLLELIIGNLLSNAIKYGRKDEHLTISWRENTKMLVFADNGPGIPANYLPYVFDRFSRSDTSRNSKIPGTGLGLSIAKKMADLQGIKLTVESEGGRGTTFFLQFQN